MLFHMHMWFSAISHRAGVHGAFTVPPVIRRGAFPRSRATDEGLKNYTSVRENAQAPYHISCFFSPFESIARQNSPRCSSASRSAFYSLEYPPYCTAFPDAQPLPPDGPLSRPGEGGEAGTSHPQASSACEWLLSLALRFIPAAGAPPRNGAGPHGS